MEGFKSLYKGGEGEIVEKKSRFIAAIAPAETEEEAMAFVESIRKKHYSARHNCYAYVMGPKQENVRCSDDGEPSGTAGRPMLDVLVGEQITNAVVVVTRYFGGTLLGTGGLVRAYQKAVKEGLKNCSVLEKKKGAYLAIRTDYNGIGKIQYLLGQKNIAILDSEYGADVLLYVIVPVEEAQELTQEIIELTNGRGKCSKEKEAWFAILDNKPVLFE